MAQFNGIWLNRLRQQGLTWGLAGILGLSWLVGCSKTTPPVANNQAEDSESSSKGSSSKGSAASGSSDSQGQRTAATKRPMIGDIPLDVWLDNPIAESKQTGSAAAAPAKTGAAAPAVAKAEPMPTDKPEPAASTADAPAAGGGDWASIISAEDIQTEIKKIRNELTQNLSAIGKYNAHYKEIAMEGAVLAALAGIAIVHPEKVSWKDHAPHVRDVAAEMAKKSKGLGQKPFDETKKEFEKLEGLLSGNPPPDLPESVADIPFSEVASRRGIMQRLQVSSDFLRANFQTEAKLGQGQDEAAQAASVVAAISKVIGTEGYGSADEEEYQAFVKLMVDSNLTMMKAARDKDFNVFSEANGKVIKYCNDCHQAYQSSGS